MKNPQIISIVLEEEIAEKSRIVAARLGSTRSQLTRKLLTDFVREHEGTAKGVSHE